MSGSPSRFSAGLAAVILQRVSDGESLLRICADPEMPGRSTVNRWILGQSGADDEFRDNYAKARDSRADRIFDELLEIADGTDVADVQKARLQVDARKWVLARMRPNKYGEKTSVDLGIGGREGAPPIKLCTSTDETLRDALETLEESGGLDG